MTLISPDNRRPTSTLHSTGLWLLVIGSLLGCGAPRSPALGQGDACVERGDLAQAILYYDEAIAQQPRLFEGYAKRGGTYLQLGEPDRARADFSQALQFKAGDPNAYFQRGTAHLQLEKYPDAIADFSQAIERGHRLAEAYQRRGEARGAQREYDEALSDFGKSIEQEPKRSRPYLQRGILYLSRLEFARAEEDFSAVIELESTSASAYWGRAEARQKLDRPSDAKKDRELAIELDPSLAVAGTVIGKNLLREARGSDENNPELSRLGGDRGQ